MKMRCVLFGLAAAVILCGCGQSETVQEREQREFQEHLSKAEAGDATGMYWVAEAYAQGSGVEKNEPLAVSWFEKCAALRNSSCVFRLAGAYHEGKLGLQQDMSRAVELYREAVAIGGPGNANMWLARIFHHGEGVPVDLDEARRNYQEVIRAYDNNSMVDEAKNALTEIGPGP